MAKVGYGIIAKDLNPIPYPYVAECKSSIARTKASLRRDEFSPITRKSERNWRRLVTISTSSNGKWKDKWTCDYVFSLQQLQLQDLAEAEEKEEEDERNSQLVSITLCIQKHAGFGLSVDGKIMTSFTSKCSNCSSPYCKKINTDFNVWVLPSSRHSSNNNTQLPEIGGDDPSVIYVKPGNEADLDSLIQETIRLATATKETCSELCEKSEPKMQNVGVVQTNASLIDGRWSRLLELKNASSQSVKFPK